MRNKLGSFSKRKTSFQEGIRDQENEWLPSLEEIVQKVIE